MSPKSQMLLAVALCGGMNRVSTAQIAAPPLVAESLSPIPAAVPPQQGIETRVIQIKNVSANLIAHWLDSAHNVVLAQYQDVNPTWAIGRPKAEISAMLSRPKDVQSVTSQDTQDAIWVIGTPEGIRQIAEKVALLDKPLRQVEIEAQCIQISSANAKTLNINFTKSEGNGALETGTASSEVRNQIAALIAQKKAKTITAPRVTAISGHKASLTSITGIPVVFNPKDETGDLAGQLKQSGLPEGQYLLYVHQSIGLTATPTINADGTVALQMGPIRTVGLSGAASGDNYEVGSANVITLRDLDDIPKRPIVLKEGQTAVLSGLNWNSSTMNFNAIDKNLSNVIVLITPRIVRRAADNDASADNASTQIITINPYVTR